MDILEQVEHYWYESAWEKNLKAPAVASEEDVAAFEQKHSVNLPADFREYFLRLNGTAEDPQLFRFWSINEIRPVDQKNFQMLDANAYFYFADFMIESWYYAIYLGADPFFQNRVILPDFPTKPVVAIGFNEFLELYLSDDPKLYGNY